MFSLLDRAAYKPSKNWTLNPFRPRFWAEWTPIYPTERVYEHIYHEYRFDNGVIGSYRAFKKKIDNYDHTLALPQNLSVSDENRAFLLGKGYAVEGKKLASIISPLKAIDHKVPVVNQPLLMKPSLVNKNTSLSIKVTSQLTSVQLEEVGPQKNDTLLALSSLGVNGAEFVNQLNNVNIVTNPDGSLSISKKVETPKTHIELVKDVPSHFMIPPTKETPPHFELIAFDDVVQTGFEIGPEEFEKKGNQVQLCAFISLLFLIAFFFNGLSSVFEFIIASIMSNEIEYRYILGTAYQFVLVGLTTVIYVTYLHLFWQYDKNRFGSPYSMWLDIKCEPLRLLPIRRTRS